MKKIIVILMAFFLVFGCAGFEVKIDKENAATVLQKSATSTVGYLIAKNNRKYIGEILDWYYQFKNFQKLGDIQTAFRDGKAKLASLISDDPFLQLQIQNAMSLLELSGDGPQVPSEIERYIDAVDWFMLGVLAAQSMEIAETSVMTGPKFATLPMLNVEFDHFPNMPGEIVECR